MEVSEYTSFLLLGLPTWVVVDGTWSILSQMADELPEEYSISAYLMLALTLGNITPLVAGYLLKRSTQDHLRKLIIYILALGGLDSLLLTWFWNSVVEVNGKEMSLPLMALFFIIGACSSTSNITHYMFVSTFQPSSTTALSLGMGLGSMLSGILAILQSLVLVNYGFSVSFFFLTLASLYLPAIYVMNKPRHSSVQHSGGTYIPVDVENLLPETILPFHEGNFLKEYFAILVIQVISSSLGYGFVPAMLSYSCSKFENKGLVLVLAGGLAAITNPWTRLLTDYYRLTTIQELWYAVIFLVFLTIVLLLCAFLPSSSSVYSASAGGALPVIAYVGFGNLFGYTNTCIFRYAKDSAVSHHVHHAFRWLAVAGQLGALLGSLLAFIMLFVAVTLDIVHITTPSTQYFEPGDSVIHISQIPALPNLAFKISEFRGIPWNNRLGWKKRFHELGHFHKIQDPQGKIKTFQGGNRFQTGMLTAPCAGGCTLCWFCGQFIPLTCGITQFFLRRKVLDYDMTKYVCFQGYFNCCCCKAGSCCESTCPCCCLCIEAHCCNFMAVSASRIYVMEKYDLTSDPCDYRLIRINNCLQCLACLCTILSIFNSAFNDCSRLVSLIADCFYHCVSGCMTAQVAFEVDYQKRVGNQGAQMGVPMAQAKVVPMD
eukprot:gene6424-7083_t